MLEIGFVSYFPPVPQRDVVLRGLPHHRRWVKYLPRTVKWLRAGNRAHPPGPRPDGHGSFRCSTPASSRFLPRAPPSPILPAARRTNRNSLIAIGLLGIGFVSYFFLRAPVVFAVSLTIGGWVKYFRQAANDWHRAEPEPCPSASPRASRNSLIKRPVRAWRFGTVPGFFTHPDGHTALSPLDAGLPSRFLPPASG